MNSVAVNRFSDAESVARAAADHFIGRVAELIGQKPTVHVLLTGGTVGIATLSAIARSEDAHLLNWSSVHFWWGDERYVAADSSDRNAVQARQAMLSKLAINEANVHEFPSTDSTLTLDEAANLFSAELKLLHPHFDFAFVGMGADGHVCSLFPERPQPARGDLVVAEHESPKPPVHRLSFSYEAMNTVDEIVFVVAGADKAAAVSQVFDGESEKLPAAKLKGKNSTIWFIDKTALPEIPST